MARHAAVNPAGGSGTDEGRDSWCTPQWLAGLINGQGFDLDPCSNERSHIKARRCLLLSNGDNGLCTTEIGHVVTYLVGGRLVHGVPGNHKIFVNPPYAHGEVIKWVRHYIASHFMFLLRFDPSTNWFAELLPRCDYVWLPGRRINFEPPPGVKSSSNPFPHALYIKGPLEAEVWDNLSANGYLLRVDAAMIALYLGNRAGQRGRGRTPESGGKGDPGQGRAGSGGGSVPLAGKRTSTRGNTSSCGCTNGCKAWECANC